MWRFRGLVFVWLILVAVGCSDKHPVSGRVVFTDGTPVPLVSIIFESEDRKTSAVGKADKDGYFEMLFEVPGDGVPPGKYDVALKAPHYMDLLPDEGKLSPGPGWGLKKKYRSGSSSGISFNVDHTISDAKIEIEKNGRK